MLAISTEPDTADDTVVDKVVNEVDVKDTRNVRVKDSVPVAAFFLLAGWELIWIELGEGVTNCTVWGALWVCGSLEGHLGGWTSLRKCHLLILLRSSRASWSTGATALSRTRRSSGSWRTEC